jgi:hypothetical protein
MPHSGLKQRVEHGEARFALVFRSIHPRRDTSPDPSKRFLLYGEGRILKLIRNQQRECCLAGARSHLFYQKSGFAVGIYADVNCVAAKENGSLVQ